MCGFIAECETTGFYHVNNWPKDNLFYGKACDIFCLELDAIDKYSSIKSTICTQSQKILTQGDWSIYLLTQPTAKNTENHFFIATNDKNKFIRCLLIMDYKGDITLDFRSLFVRYSSLEW